MKLRPLGNSGIDVSEVGLGCWQIGWCWGDVTDKEARTILVNAIECGVNFFDTSDTYGDGRSERFLAELFKEHPDIFITTKLGRRIRGTNYPRGYKNGPMEEFVDRSLKNLGLECIDLVQMHCPPVDVCESDDTYQVMDSLVKKGKVKAYGISVYNLSEAYAAIDRSNVKTVQLVFNMFRQAPADEFFKYASARGVGIIARGPLASGLLSGEIFEDTTFPENDHRNYNIDGSAFDIGDTFSGVNVDEGVKAVRELSLIKPEGFSMAQFALKWILSHVDVSTVIPGAVNSTQVGLNCQVSDLPDLSPKCVADVKAIYQHYIEPSVKGRWT